MIDDAGAAEPDVASEAVVGLHVALGSRADVAEVAKVRTEGVDRRGPQLARSGRLLPDIGVQEADRSETRRAGGK